MGFFKNLLKGAMMTKMGIVSGSDFQNGFLCAAHKEGAPALGIVCRGQEDYIFAKSDVAEFTVLETNAKFLMEGNAKVGSKYRILFKDGKSAILSVPAAVCTNVENILY